jgi:hypothetical protein
VLHGKGDGPRNEKLHAFTPTQSVNNTQLSIPLQTHGDSGGVRDLVFLTPQVALRCLIRQVDALPWLSLC